MEIKQVANEKPEVLVKKIEIELKVDFPELREIENVTEPVEGYLLHGINGSEQDSNVVHLFGISNGNEGATLLGKTISLRQRKVMVLDSTICLRVLRLWRNKM